MEDILIAHKVCPWSSFQFTSPTREGCDSPQTLEKNCCYICEILVWALCLQTYPQGRKFWIEIYLS